MTHDALDIAYATLGLRRDASGVAVKRQYRALVKRWHPDQFAGDRQGVAEATLMLKAINRAYRTILEHRAPDAIIGIPQRESEARPSGFGEHLSQHDRDDIIEAIRHSDALLAIAFEDDVSGWRSRTASMAVVLVYVVSAWQSGRAARVVAACALPLLCIWFPAVLGAQVGGRITKPSPPALVWFFGWIVLLVPALAIGIIWLRS